jgi:hypothetical protein
MGNTPRFLTALAFNATSGANSFARFTVKLVHVRAADLTTNFINNYGGYAPTTVHYSDYSVSGATAGWKTIPFNTPFLYNGKDNLLIEISSGSPGNDTTSVMTRRTSESGWRRVLYADYEGAATGSRQSYRNTMQFTYNDSTFYTISGTIKDVYGTPVSGVSLDGLPYPLITDTNGFYSFVVPQGWSGTVMPRVGNYVFAPGAFEYSAVSANHSGRDYTAYSTVGVETKTASATYSSGDIPTDSSFTNLPGTSRSPGSLAVPLPSDAIITGTDVTYKMTAQNGARMNEQISWLRCTSSVGIGERGMTWGVGVSTNGGTYTYARTNLDIANAVRGGGNVNFELHAGRTRSASGHTGVSTYNSKVDNNTWILTVKYIQMSLLPGITISPRDLEITEGETGQFGVSLGKAPTSNVTLNVQRVSGSTNIVVQSGASLTFTPSNWNTDQMVTIYASQDANWTNDVATFRCVDPSGRYADSPLITVTELDIDIDPSRILPFSENFDDAGKASTVGALNGQHGWIAGQGATIVANAGIDNSKALRLASGYAEHDFVNGSNVVALSVWSKPAAAEDDPGTPPEDVTAVFWVDSNNFVRVYNGNTVVTLPIAVDTNAYNHFQAWVNYDANTWRLDINGTTAFEAYATYANNATFSRIRLEQGTAEPAYFDNIQISSALPPPVEQTPFQQWLIENEMDPDACETDLCASGTHSLYEAYIAGIDPLDAEARFEIKQTSMAAGDNITLQWQGVTGRIYNVYWSSNLLHGAGFQLIASNLPYTAASYTNTMTNGQGYYRITVQRE